MSEKLKMSIFFFHSYMEQCSLSFQKPRLGTNLLILLHYVTNILSKNQKKYLTFEKI